MKLNELVKGGPAPKMGKEHSKQVQIVLDYIKSGEMSKEYHAQMESSEPQEIDPAIDATTDRIFNDCTFLK